MGALSLWFFSRFFLCMVPFVYTWLISALSLMITCLLLFLGELPSFCSRALRCALKLVVFALSIFLLEELRAKSFSLSTAFIVSHEFRSVVHSFSLNSKKSLIFLSLFLPWSHCHWVEYCSASMCIGLSVVIVAIEDHSYPIVIW